MELGPLAATKAWPSLQVIRPPRLLCEMNREEIELQMFPFGGLSILDAQFGLETDLRISHEYKS